MQTRIPHNSPLSPWLHRAALCAPLALCSLALCAPPVLAAQAAAAPAPAVPAHRPAHAHKRAAATPAPATPATPAAAIPPAPELPQWPVNDKPGDAAITWDSQGLRIQAANSSLQQILKDVSATTGATVEGLTSDERVFGAYGPGSARDVLSQLLQGSGYNVIMIGDQGQGTPRQILLSSRHGAAAAAGNPDQVNPGEEDAESDEQQQAPPNIRPGFAPGAPPRTPQQIMQEMQQRQQQMQQRMNQPQQ